MAKTLYEKLFDAHVVYEAEGETPILYINRHLIHEVTSPQAFDGLRVAGRQVRQVSKTFGTMDHSISTQVRDVNKLEGQAKIQVLELAKNTKATDIQLLTLFMCRFRALFFSCALSRSFNTVSAICLELFIDDALLFKFCF